MSKLQKKHIIEVLTLIRVNYDNAYRNQDENETELLVRSWYNFLSKYDYETVIAATQLTISKSEYVPRLSNIINAAEKLINPNAKSDEELWAELTASLGRVYEVSRYLSYPQYQKWAKQKLQEIYDGLDDDIKLYVVNTSSLIEIAELNTDSMPYEKARFLKQMPVLKNHKNDKVSAQKLLEQIGGVPQLPDTKKNK